MYRKHPFSAFQVVRKLSFNIGEDCMAERWQPWTWKAPQGDAGGKRSLNRQDGHDRVSGQAVYTRDIKLPGMLVCVNDVGHVFNIKGAEGQQYGGAVMGLSRSATEEKIWCPRTGVGLNHDLMGYHMGTMNDYPPAQCILNESHLGYSSYGTCGVGEDVGASMSGITAGAIYNATSKWILDFPITPDKVLKALGKI